MLQVLAGSRRDPRAVLGYLEGNEERAWSGSGWGT
jgi:hypothetical protein